MYRIFLSPLLVVIVMLFVPSVEKALFYLPLIFSLSVCLVNHSKVKINKTLGFFLPILQSYAVFLGLAVVVFFFDEWLQKILADTEDGIMGIALVTFGGYLAAMLLFYFYTYIFRVTNLRFSYMTITLFYAVVVIIMQVFSKNEFLQFGVEKFASYLISWCIVMSLAFSLSLNREEYLLVVERKKNS